MKTNLLGRCERPCIFCPFDRLACQCAGLRKWRTGRCQRHAHHRFHARRKSRDGRNQQPGGCRQRGRGRTGRCRQATTRRSATATGLSSQQQQYRSQLQRNKDQQEEYRDRTAAYESLRARFAAERAAYRRGMAGALCEVGDRRARCQLIGERVELITGSRVGTVIDTAHSPTAMSPRCWCVWTMTRSFGSTARCSLQPRRRYRDDQSGRRRSAPHGRRAPVKPSPVGRKRAERLRAFSFPGSFKKIIQQFQLVIKYRAGGANRAPPELRAGRPSAPGICELKPFISGPKWRIAARPLSACGSASARRHLYIEGRPPAFGNRAVSTEP